MQILILKANIESFYNVIRAILFLIDETIRKFTQHLYLGFRIM